MILNLFFQDPTLSLWQNATRSLPAWHPGATGAAIRPED